MNTLNDRVRSWHECLYKLLPDSSSTSPRLRKRFKAGQEVHGVIEGMFPWAANERRGRYVDETLPFTIDYHPDIWDRAGSRVWEIKPVGWFFTHYEYCVAQLSGYMHFTRASLAGFMLYRLRRWDGGRMMTVDDIEGPWPYVPPTFNSWEFLRKVAMESDTMLLMQGR